MREGAKDIRSGQAFDVTVFFDEAVDIHHIFPQDWCKAHKIDVKVYDTVINKTPLSYRTNRIIGGVAPSKYLEKLQHGKTKANGQIEDPPIPAEVLDGYLASHCISPALLHADDFEQFMKERRKALLTLISKATGHPILGDVGEADEGEGSDGRGGARQWVDRGGVGPRVPRQGVASMKAVTVRQPFAWAIAAGFKDIENRSWAPRVEPGEIIVIHAGLGAPDEDDVRRVQKLVGRRTSVPEEYDCGAIVFAVAHVAKVVASSRSPWFSGPLGWVLEEVTSVREPIDCKGQLGRWKVPAAVEARLKRQLRSMAARSRRGA